MDDCSGIPQLGYGEFSEWLHRKVGNQRIPITGSLEVTMRCNLRCQHCYIPIKLRAGSNNRELSLPEIKRILDEVTDAGCLWLLLTGGEPLLRKDLLDIYAYAKHKGLIVTLFTNGTLMNRRIVDYLAEWRPFDVEITLYGATQETYEKVTGIPGSYTRCRKGIDLCMERNLPLRLKTMVITLNRHELDQMESLASNLGLKFRFDPIVNPAIDGSARPTFFRLSPEEIVTLDKSDPERSILWQKEFTKKLVMHPADKRMYLCGAGVHGFHIDAVGNLSVCLTARKPSYDLRNGSFQEGWLQFFPKVLDRRHSADFPCLSCNLRLVCAQCPAVAELENGENIKPVEFLCQVTKLRHAVFSTSNDV